MGDFDDVYWAHQPPEVQALRAMDYSQLYNRALQLAIEGFTIDVPIMMWRWDPLLVMQMRQGYGYTWVPSALMAPVQMAPGLTMPGATPYDPNNPPPGAIRVSTDPADYPPFAPPPPPPGPPVPPTDVIGAPVIGMTNMFYAVGAATTWPDGAMASDTRGTFRLHRARRLMGDAVWFEQVG